MFNWLYKKTLRTESNINRCTDNLDKLILLTKKMDQIENRRRKHEYFIEEVIRSVDPKLLERNEDGVFIFLTTTEAVKIMKQAVEKALIIVREN